MLKSVREVANINYWWTPLKLCVGLLTSTACGYLMHKTVLATSLTYLNIRYPPLVYINSLSHRFNHKVSTSSLS
jgi:hypothetical protein